MAQATRAFIPEETVRIGDAGALEPSVVSSLSVQVHQHAQSLIDNPPAQNHNSPPESFGRSSPDEKDHNVLAAVIGGLVRHDEPCAH